MRIKIICVMLVVVSSIMGGEKYILESRYRNPIDTSNFKETPTMLVFVHSKCEHGGMCATLRMQKALESDALGFRDKYGIKLYVIYPSYSKSDIETFDSFSPTDATKIAFYTDSRYYGSFNEGRSTPYVIYYDGKGNIYTKLGGTIEELNDSICNMW